MIKILPFAAIILFLCAFDSTNGTPPAGSSPSLKTNRELFKKKLLFIENKGQLTDADAGHTANSVLFYAGDADAKVYVTKTGLHYQFLKATLPGSGPQAESMPRIQAHRYSVNLKNANPNPVVRKEAETIYTERHLRPGVEGDLIAGSYRKIILENVYPGIDWVLYTDRQDEDSESFKYDFIVKPGADPSLIQLEVEDADDTYIDEIGAMVMKTKLGEVKELPPVSYCDHLTVPTQFKEIRKNLYGFRIEPYDTSKTLVIDPEIKWLTYYTGIGLTNDIADNPAGSATDAEGNIYMMGTTLSATGIAHNGYQNNLNGQANAFIVKFNSNGERLWSTYFGGSVYEFGHSCVVDPAGNLYFTGKAHSNDLPATPGAHQSALSDHGALPVAEAYDVFLGKMNGSGALLWATYFGGNHSDKVYGCATDAGGNVYICGETRSNDLPTDATSFQKNYSGSEDQFQYDAFLAKFSSTGVFQWTTYYGGAYLFEHGHACATDTEGNVLMAGRSSGGIGTTPEVFQTTNGGGGGDAFLAKFSTNGERIWATYLGGSDSDEATACTTDPDGNIYVAGNTESANFPVLLPFQNTYGGGDFFGDAFLAKFDKTGTLLWSTYYGGDDDEDVTSCTIDMTGNVYIAGRTRSLNGIAFNGFLDDRGPYQRGFVVKFNPGGRGIWGSYIGGDFAEVVKNVATDHNSNLYVIGATVSSDLATPGAFKTENTYGTEAYFIAKIFDDTSLPTPVVYVNKKATGANNGTSWANAYTSLQDALASVCSGGNTVNEQTQIWVATDTYYPDAGIGLTLGDRDLSFDLCNKSAVYGGFNGTESHLWERNVDTNPTILSGDIDKNGTMDNNNSFGVVSTRSNTVTGILDGFTITLGNANKVNCSPSSKGCNGGGLFIPYGSSPAIRNSRFINNSTRDDGGGIFSDGGNLPLKISNCVFQQNSSEDGGGGLSISGGRTIIINSLFAGNSTLSSFGGGGGIHGSGVSYLKILNTTIAGNAVGTSDNGSYGGGISLRLPKDVIIKNTIIQGNSSGIRLQHSSNPDTPPSEPEISYSLIQGLDGTSGTGNINGNTDPKFKDTGAGDYQLTPGSPVVNKGDPETGRYLFPENNGNTPIDLATNERFYGPRIDMGAYELIHESALPVSLATFTAALQENTALLTWRTTEEINASHFEIQRSTDARAFETIGTVKAKGRSEGIQAYFFTDFLPLIAGMEEIKYYRLRIVDSDNTFTYSPIVSVRRKNTIESAGAILYPNPAADRVSLKSVGWDEIKTLRLYNQAGQEISYTVDQLNRSLIVSHLPTGLYLLRVEKTDNRSQTYRLVIGR